MAVGIRQGRFQFQRGASEERAKSDLILLDGELAIESDTTKIKVGNGKSLYEDLPYISIGNIDVNALTNEEIKLVQGPKGEKGDPLTFKDLTIDQKQELAQKIAKWFRGSIDDEIGKMNDKVFESNTKCQDDTIYLLEPTIEDGKASFTPKAIGKLIKNEFFKTPIRASKINFRVKSTSAGIILLYSLTDEDLQYAIHVTNHIRDYEIDFGKNVDEEFVFTTVTMPEDKVSLVKESV